MRVAAAVGINFSDFWQMTPFELEIYADAFAERKKHENHYSYQLAVITSFLASRWVWAKRVNVDKYLQTDEKKSTVKNMTDDELIRTIKNLNFRLGGDNHGR